MDEAKMGEALNIAELYAPERNTKMGLLSQAVLELWGRDGRAEPPAVDGRRHGVVVARPTWLSDTGRVQREVYRLDPDSVAYVREQAFAAMVEVAECVQELPWKGHRDGLSDGAHRSLAATVPSGALERARKEAIDTMHFLANILVALGFDDDSLWEEYNGVTCRNVDRRRRAEEKAGLT